jgi:hypothetical protein
MFFTFPKDSKIIVGKRTQTHSYQIVWEGKYDCSLTMEKEKKMVYDYCGKIRELGKTREST